MSRSNEHDHDGRQRRAYVRAPLGLMVQFRLDDLDTFMQEYAGNISQGGMFIRTSQPQPVGNLVYFQMSLVGGEQLLEGLGRVVHVNGASDDNPGMGLEFVNLDAASQARIDDIVAQRLANQSADQ